MNNILVTDRYYPNDPMYPHEYSYMITDIGEGKVLKPGQDVRDLTDHRPSYGAVEFRAPEVRGKEGWSTKAEVFSFGVIACKIMEYRRHISTSLPPEWVLSELGDNHSGLKQDADTAAHIVPARLKSAIKPCLSHSPDDRPSMRDVVRTLDDLMDEFIPDSILKDKRKVKWVNWKWNESLRDGRLGPSQIDKGNTGNKGSDQFAGFATVVELPP
jgi:hypothetical protein